MAILHVDDQGVIRELVGRALATRGSKVVSVEGVRDAKLALAECGDFAGALLDVRLRDGSGVELYRWITAHYPALASRVAFVTGSADAELFLSLAASGCRTLRKPFELAELMQIVADWEDAADGGLR